MLVSVITSVYNCENYIEEMMNSILNQSLQDWEMIIIDDASTDTTWDLISSYTDNRITSIRNTENFGLTRNLNKAISYARGKYIVRMDGDDIAYSNRFEKQVQYMEEHPDILLSGGGVKFFGKKEDVRNNILDNEFLKINLIFDAVISHPTFIIRKDIMDQYKLRYNENLQYAQDYDLEFQVSKYGKIANISDILVKYRLHDGQISVEKRLQQLECANVTRKAILKQVNVILEKKLFNYWQRFCLMDYHILTSEEINELQSICNKIIYNNKIKKIYNSEKLEKIIKSRMKAYVEKCQEMTINVVNNVEASNKYYSLFLMMCYWFKIKQEGKHLSSFFNRNNIKEVAIYGIGHVGQIFISELQESEIIVKYGIDKDINTQYFNDNIKILRPTDELENVEAVVVTPITYYEEIKEILTTKIDCPIYSLQDILYEL